MDNEQLIDQAILESLNNGKCQILNLFDTFQGVGSTCDVTDHGADYDNSLYIFFFWGSSYSCPLFEAKLCKTNKYFFWNLSHKSRLRRFFLNSSLKYTKLIYTSFIRHFCMYCSRLSVCRYCKGRSVLPCKWFTYSFVEILCLASHHPRPSNFPFPS